MNKQVFVISMAVIGASLTGCSLLPPLPEYTTHFDNGETVSAYTHDGYFFYKNITSDGKTHCLAEFDAKENPSLQASLETLDEVIYRHKVLDNCSAFSFTSGSSSLRNQDPTLGFERTQSETKCRVAIGENPPVNAAEAQSWEELARDSFPDCEQVQIITFQTNSKEREAE